MTRDVPVDFATLAEARAAREITQDRHGWSATHKVELVLPCVRLFLTDNRLDHDTDVLVLLRELDDNDRYTVYKYTVINDRWACFVPRERASLADCFAYIEVEFVDSYPEP